MKNTARRLIQTVAVGAAVALAAAGCASASGNTSGGSTPAVIKWASASPQANWDPVVTGATGASILLGNIYAPFLTENPDGSLAPGLVESWEYNGDGTAVTFTLKPDLTFQDGSPVDAEAAAFYFERAKTQENSALIGSYANIDSVTADSELDFTVHLKEVDYQVPYLLSIRAGFLPSQEASEASASDLNSKLPVGAGPFEVVEYVPESRIVLEKFDGYWDADNIHIDRIEIDFGIDAASIVSAIRTGVYNFAQLGGPQLVEAREAGLDVVEDISKNWGVNFLSVNRSAAPFDDPRVVDAFRYAIDSQEFVDSTLLGEGVATHQPLPPGHVFFNEELEEEYGYDPDEARRLLAEAGYADGLELTLSASPWSSTAQSELVQSQLAAVGVTVEIENDPNWAQGYFSKEDPFALYGWVGRNSPTQLLTEHYDVDGVLNLSSPYTTPEFTEAIHTLRSTPIEDPGFVDLVKQTSAIGYRTGSTIPLTAQASAFVKTADISSEFHNGQGWLNWAGVTIGDE